MESKKSQGPSRKAVAVSAALLCVVLVGASYFLRDEGQGAASELTPPATSTLQFLLDRCEGGPTHEAFEGRTRTRCLVRTHPAFMLDLVGSGDELDTAKMMVPMHGDKAMYLERRELGFDLFTAVAGTDARSFLPVEFLDATGVSRASFDFEERTYTTIPVANVGLVFDVAASSAAPSTEN